MIVIDTSALIDSLCEPRRSFDKLQMLIESGEQLTLSSLVLYEWLRGPRKREELLDQERLFPRELVVVFGGAEAARAAELFRSVSRARTRGVDLAIAATAMLRDAPLWTLNPEDFKDISGLRIV